VGETKRPPRLRRFSARARHTHRNLRRAMPMPSHEPGIRHPAEFISFGLPGFGRLPLPACAGLGPRPMCCAHGAGPLFPRAGGPSPPSRVTVASVIGALPSSPFEFQLQHLNRSFAEERSRGSICPTAVIAQAHKPDLSGCGKADLRLDARRLRPGRHREATDGAGGGATVGARAVRSVIHVTPRRGAMW
jgi:hypothetical protein